MSDAKRFYAADDFSGEECVYASDYDTLARRCRELEAQRDEAIMNGSALLATLDDAEQERDALRAEVERLRKDAVRWRFNRAKSLGSPEAADAAIDAAMAAKEGV